MGNRTEKGQSISIQGLILRGNLLTVRWTAKMESWCYLMDHFIEDSSRNLCLMEKESLPQLWGPPILVFGRKVCLMERAKSIFLMVIAIKVIFPMESNQDKAFLSGQMEECMKANSEVEWWMDLANSIKGTRSSFKESFKITKRSEEQNLELNMVHTMPNLRMEISLEKVLLSGMIKRCMKGDSKRVFPMEVALSSYLRERIWLGFGRRARIRRSRMSSQVADRDQGQDPDILRGMTDINMIKIECSLEIKSGPISQGNCFRVLQLLKSFNSHHT